jgi:hypothetical protein
MPPPPMNAAAALLKRTAVPEECGAAGGQPVLKSTSEGPAPQIISPMCLLVCYAETAVGYSQLAKSLTLAIRVCIEQWK